MNVTFEYEFISFSVNEIRQWPWQHEQMLLCIQHMVHKSIQLYAIQLFKIDFATFCLVVCHFVLAASVIDM